MVASRSASKMACMSSARPITPSSATDLWAAITSSMPGRVAATRRAPVTGSPGPAGAVDGVVWAADTVPSRPRAPAPAPPQSSGVSPREP